MTLYTANADDGAAWITGASKGIGRETAILLARKGFRVYGSARSAEDLESLSEELDGPGEFIPLPLDVADREACRAAVERITRDSGKLALAIFNAGTFHPVRGFDLGFREFEKSMDLNFFGVLNGLVPAVDAMKEAGFGHVAIVSSSASYGGLPKSAAYGASKSAIVNMAASLKFDLDPMNIRIQVVTPGFVRTPLTDKNDFPMPFLLEADEAARALVDGLESGAFDITFPKRFTYMLKALNLLPYRLYFPIVAFQTGIGRKRRDGKKAARA